MIRRENKPLRTVTYWGAAANVCLALVKSIVGVLVGSLALLADGMHSLSDLGTDLVTVMGISMGEKPRDAEHPYGHGKVETLAQLLVVLALISIGLAIIWESASSIYLGISATASKWVLGIAGVSVLVKELLYQITRRVSIRYHSSLIYANAWHHRSDALSSVAVLAGGVSLFLGFHYGDQIAALVVGLMVIVVAGKIAMATIFELTEGAADPETIKAAEEVLNHQEGVRSWHLLRTRKLGRALFMDVHILVNPDLSVAQGHRISQAVEGAIARALARPVNLLVHVEPDILEERGAPEADNRSG